MPARTLLLLVSLYFCQGLPFGFFTQALPVLMRLKGYSLPVIGSSALLALPWALKFLWAPLVDTHGSVRYGRRRSWIIPIQLLSVVTMAALIPMEPGRSLTGLYAFVFLMNLLAATQDIATDALAVELLDSSQRGLGNGLQVAAYRAGMIVGGGAILIALPYLGWATCMAIMSGLLALFTIPILLHSEAPVPPPASETESLIGAFLRRPGTGRWLGLLVLYKWGESMGSGMVRPLLVDRGLDLKDIGWLLGTGGFTAGLAGALLGGALTQRWGQRRALFIFGAIQTAAVGSYLLPAAGFADRMTLTATCLLEHASSGMATAALFTAMMGRARAGVAATDYTIQASTVVMAAGFAVTLSGFTANWFGYVVHYALSTVLCLVPLAFLHLHPDLGSPVLEE